MDAEIRAAIRALPTLDEASQQALVEAFARALPTMPGSVVMRVWRDVTNLIAKSEADFPGEEQAMLASNIRALFPKLSYEILAQISSDTWRLRDERARVARQTAARENEAREAANAIPVAPVQPPPDWRTFEARLQTFSRERTLAGTHMRMSRPATPMVNRIRSMARRHGCSS